MLDGKRLSQLLSRTALPVNSCEEQFMVGYDLGLAEVLFKECISVAIDRLTHIEYIYLTVGYAMGQASVASHDDEFQKDDKSNNDNIH